MVNHNHAFIWGSNLYGQLGSGKAYGITYPTKLNVDDIVGWTQIEFGNFHTVAISTDGEVFTWGLGEQGQLGYGGIESRNVPTKVGSLCGEKIVKVACGGWHTAAVTVTGKLFTW